MEPLDDDTEDLALLSGDLLPEVNLLEADLLLNGTLLLDGDLLLDGNLPLAGDLSLDGDLLEGDLLLLAGDTILL